MAELGIRMNLQRLAIDDANLWELFSPVTAQGQGIRDHLVDLGDQAATYAQSLAPVSSFEESIRFAKSDPKGRYPGRLRDSIHVELGEDVHGFTRVTFGSSMPYARRQEFTHPTQSGYLRRAAIAIFGLDRLRNMETSFRREFAHPQNVSSRFRLHARLTAATAAALLRRAVGG